MLDLSKIMETGFEPQSEEDWDLLSALSMKIFDPRSPIDDQRFFSGRITQVNDVLEAVYQKGGHAVIFGERGVGKTSLAKIIDQRVPNIVGSMSTIFVSCGVNDDFYTIWGNAFNEHAVGDSSPVEYFRGQNNPYTVYNAITENIDEKEHTLFIFDEFDRIRDKNSLFLMADLMKHFSNQPVNATVIVVGVGETLDELFESHESISRCCSQIKMPRMSAKELRTILDDRFPHIGLKVEQPVENSIIELSQGLPGYVHLLAQQCMKNAIKRRSNLIESEDFEAALRRALEKADQRTRQDYYKATSSTKPDSKYEEVLIACALADSNELGWFNAGSIREPYSMIRKKKMEIPNYSTNLANLCSKERGPALTKSGTAKRYQYRFSNPLLQPFSVMMGVEKGLIQLSDIRR